MVYHILNGDALAYSFPGASIPGGTIVVREALIEGNLAGDNLPDFWQTRARHIGVPEAEYYSYVVKEFEKIMQAPGNSEFNLWFEYDLFCQVNMWFVISLINSLPVEKKVYAVYTTYLDKTSDQFWNGFGQANADEISFCFTHRRTLSNVDLQLGQELWEAYKNGYLDGLVHLSKRRSATFPYLEEVIQAHVDRFPKDGTKGRPEQVLEDIAKNGCTDFNEVFKEFWKKESIYGFGDLQVKQLYNKVMNDH